MHKPPLGPMGSKPFTAALYDALVEGYRRYPGQHSAVARMAGCDKRTARRAWEGPPYTMGGREFAQPIRELFAAEEKVRQERLTLDLEEEAQRQEEERQKREELAKERDRNRGHSMRLGGHLVIRGYAALSKLVPGLEKQAERSAEELVRGTNALGQPLNLSPEVTLRMIRSFNGAVKQLGDFHERMETLARLDEGLPTDIVGIGNAAPSTFEELEAQRQIAEIALARARSRRVLPSAPLDQGAIDAEGELVTVDNDEGDGDA